MDDDLAELRRMINNTKKNISDYAGDMYDNTWWRLFRYHLNQHVQGANKNAKTLGYGVNERIFDDMDRGFYKYMPSGDKNEIFDQTKVRTKSTIEKPMRKSSTAG